MHGLVTPRSFVSDTFDEYISTVMASSLTVYTSIVVNSVERSSEVRGKGHESPMMKEVDKMTIYVALLRGINVSGQKIIKMENLRAIFESLQFHNVKTYIQSGNVIFETTEDKVGVLGQSIESKLEEALGFKVTVLVRTRGELEDVIQQNPFAGSEDVEDRQLYVTFLSQTPTAKAIDVLASYQDSVDDVRVVHREAYLLCRKGYGRTLFSNRFLETKLGVLATTRNWTTVNKLVNMARGAETSKRRRT